MITIDIEKTVEKYNEFERNKYFGVKCITSNELYQRFNIFLRSVLAKEIFACYELITPPDIFWHAYYRSLRIPERFERVTPKGASLVAKTILKSKRNEIFGPLIWTYVAILKSYEFRKSGCEKNPKLVEISLGHWSELLAEYDQTQE